MGDFSVNKAPGDCEKSVGDHLGSLGFAADPDSAGSTTVFRKDADPGRDDPSLLKTMLGVASNVLLSSSSGWDDEENTISVQVVVLEEGDDTRLVVDAPEPDLQRDLDGWVASELGGRPQG